MTYRKGNTILEGSTLAIAGLFLIVAIATSRQANESITELLLFLRGEPNRSLQCEGKIYPHVIFAGGENIVIGEGSCKPKNRERLICDSLIKRNTEYTEGYKCRGAEKSN